MNGKKAVQKLDEFENEIDGLYIEFKVGVKINSFYRGESYRVHSNTVQPPDPPEIDAEYYLISEGAEKVFSVENAELQNYLREMCEQDVYDVLTEPSEWE